MLMLASCMNIYIYLKSIIRRMNEFKGRYDDRWKEWASGEVYKENLRHAKRVIVAFLAQQLKYLSILASMEYNKMTHIYSSSKSPPYLKLLF
jgi:hypothetical protein